MSLKQDRVVFWKRDVYSIGAPIENKNTFKGGGGGVEPGEAILNFGVGPWVREQRLKFIWKVSKEPLYRYTFMLTRPKNLQRQ